MSFPKPPDVPDYVEVPVTYAAGTDLNVLGDGVSADGGTPPAAAYELADIPHDPTGWANEDPQGENYFCTLIPHGGTCVEPKARFAAEFTHILRDDPIRNYGMPGTSHLHIFFGNASVNAYSTFETLRLNAEKYSFSSGGPLNGTGYWMPAIIKDDAFVAGEPLTVRISHATFYYREPDPAESDRDTYLLLGLRYVTGYNMDDAGAWLQQKVDEANAQPGTDPNRYRVCEDDSSTGCGANHRYVCGGVDVQNFANADGSDPWAGGCPASEDIILQFNGATCWDGVNLWSPGGYKHVIPKIYDSFAGQRVCPNGWYQLPQLVFNISLQHEGPEDYTKWRLASDPHGPGVNSTTFNGATMLRGETFHVDWMNGWDRTVLHSWLDNCVGVGAQAHECNDSTVGPNMRLHRAEPPPNGSRTETVRTTTFGQSSPDLMWPYPDPYPDDLPDTVHVHGHD